MNIQDKIKQLSAKPSLPKPSFATIKNEANEITEVTVISSFMFSELGDIISKGILAGVLDKTHSPLAVMYGKKEDLIDSFMEDSLPWFLNVLEYERDETLNHPERVSINFNGDVYKEIRNKLTVLVNDGFVNFKSNTLEQGDPVFNLELVLLLEPVEKSGEPAFFNEKTKKLNPQVDLKVRFYASVGAFTRNADGVLTVVSINYTLQDKVVSDYFKNAT